MLGRRRRVFFQHLSAEEELRTISCVAYINYTSKLRRRSCRSPQALEFLIILHPGFSRGGALARRASGSNFSFPHPGFSCGGALARRASGSIFFFILTPWFFIFTCFFLRGGGRRPESGVRIFHLHTCLRRRRALGLNV